MRARRNLTCVAKRRYTAMPKSVDPAQPAQAELRCLLSGLTVAVRMAAIAAAPNARFPFAQRSLSVFSRTSAPCLGLIGPIDVAGVDSPEVFRT
jgi:hypothetical protein